MEMLLYVEMNIFSLVVLTLIFFNIYHRNRSEMYLFEQKLYLGMLGINALILIMDTGMWALDGRDGFWFRELYIVITAIYYMFNPIICMLWAFYVDYLIYRDEMRLRKITIPLLIPAIMNTILSIISMIEPIMFTIDENNIYHRGRFFYIMAITSYVYLIHSLCLLISKRHTLRKSDFLSILGFFIPPFVGGILQSIFYGLSLIWVSVTISLLIIFINLQNDQLYTDYLTGLFNRRQLDNYLSQRIKNGEKYSSKKRIMAGIMIDIDAFKSINDVYGHAVGDQALISTANIFKKTFKKLDFVSRYGGDEFVIIMEMNNKADVTAAIEKLNKNVDRYNAQKLAPYTIQLSIGYDYYDFDSEVTEEEFLKHIDTIMYNEKSKKQASQNKGISQC